MAPISRGSNLPSLRQPKGTSSQRSSYGSVGTPKINLLQSILVTVLCCIFSFYGGLMIGMNGNNNNSNNSDNNNNKNNNNVNNNEEKLQRSLMDLLNDASIDQIKKIAKKKGLDFDNNKNNQKQKSSNSNSNSFLGGGNNRRFPRSMEEYAVGMSRIKKEDFIEKYDLGIPVDASTSINSDVLVIYNHKTALPSKSYDQTQNNSPDGIPQLSAVDATTNCNTMKVVVLDKGQKMKNECTAIIGQWESYHIQKWMRLPDTNKVKAGSLSSSLPLLHVSKSHNDKNQPMRIPDQKTTMKFWTQMLSKYFSSIETVLKELKPIAQKIAKDNTIIVMTCNQGQSELLMNFVCNANAKKLDISQVLIFATDKQTKELAEGLGLATYYDEINFGYLPSGHARDYGDPNFTGMMMAKVYCVQMISFLGYDVLFQDVDIIWFKNPLPYFHNPPAKYANFDMYFQDDGARTSRYAPYSPNTGFYYVRNNERTQYFFSVFLRMGDMIQLSGSHQSALTQVLTEHVTWRGLRVKVFNKDDSANDFPGGYHWNNPSKKPFMKELMTDKVQPYIFHMSWTMNKVNKLKYFRQMNEWYVNDKCIAPNDKTKVSIPITPENCCSAEPIFSCHYKDKPSKKPCKDSPPIDKGRPSWW